MDEMVKNNKLENLIYEVRGKQVLLDSDLAILYGTSTKRINEAVSRNPNKFPDRFCFSLDEYEISILRSHFATANINSKSRNMPTVFTEQGVYMLATILKGEIATNMTIRIMDTFVIMRKYITNNLVENNYYKDMLMSHDNRLKILEEKFKTQNSHLFYEGQIYDAYSLMLDIFNTSMSKIIIIDNYIDKNILDILSKTNKQIILITNKYNNEDYKKYKTQYDNVILKINNSFHDRFIIIDDKTLYHSGASFKDLGKKCFSITKIEDDEILQNLLSKLKIS